MLLVLVVPMLVTYPINGTQYDVNNTHFWWTNSNERNAKLVVIPMSVRKLKCVKWVQWSSFSEWNIQLNALNNTLRWDHESLQKFTLNLLDIKKRKISDELIGAEKFRPFSVFRIFFWRKRIGGKSFFVIDVFVQRGE